MAAAAVLAGPGYRITGITTAGKGAGHGNAWPRAGGSSRPWLTLIALSLGLMMVLLDTSIVSVANPAIGIGRMFSDTFAGIAPASMPGYVVAQLIGGACALLAIWVLYPDVTPAEAEEVLLPHHETGAAGQVSQPLPSQP